MLKQLMDFIRKRRFAVQTFTYYIPGPPERKTSYRETQFDREFYSFMKEGFELISIELSPHQNAKQSGMWVVATVRPLNKKASDLILKEGVLQDSSLEIDYEHN